MSKNKKTEGVKLDIAGLLALKAYEHPDAGRAEKNIQNTMRAVRSTSNIQTLFPDKSFGWMFAQPRYGVAALFVLFLGLHLLERPLPDASVGSMAVVKAPDVEMLASIDTNQIKASAIPGLSSPLSVAGEPATLSSYLK
ncbi:MAG: hypothetical protein WCH86_01590 [Kiritimatiellales bacterium]